MRERIRLIYKQRVIRRIIKVIFALMLFLSMLFLEVTFLCTDSQSFEVRSEYIHTMKKGLIYCVLVSAVLSYCLYKLHYSIRIIEDLEEKIDVLEDELGETKKYY